MDVADEIRRKERIIYLLKNMISLAKDAGMNDYVKELEEEIKEKKESLEHDRKVQKIESAVSGRKTWKEVAWKYFLIFFGGMAFLKIIEFIISKL